MKADVLLCRLEELSHMALRQPDRLTFKADIELEASILGAVDKELPVRRRILLSVHLKRPAEGLVQQRLLQSIQSSNFLGVDVREAVGFRL